MGGDLLIVSRSQRSLYDYLRDDFQSDPDVEVLMDRRHGERRQARAPWTAERRRGDRRTRPPIDEKLTSIGFAIVRIE
ncbi:MAG: hypothetical protein HYR51_17050 [Candidatus Rokubacteria bacterium]|nr:hypothetical protein [Candidatus Rokubacteria bacterium]